MKNFLIAMALCVGSVASAEAAGPTKIFIASDNGFEVNLAAAINRKDVSATVVLNESEAQYVLEPTPVVIHQESGLSKYARCAFAFCVGIEDSGDVSVQLVDRANKSVVWAYEVAKQRAAKNRQSMAEAVAKHLQKEFFEQGWGKQNWGARNVGAVSPANPNAGTTVAANTVPGTH